MISLFPANKVNYILRTYLPHWRYEERVEEIVRFCKETGVGHVMLFTDAQHMVWNQLNEAEIECETATLKKARERLGRAGIRLGLNSTYNMAPSVWDHRAHNDYDHWVTYADGTTEYRVPCLLDPKLDRYLDMFYRRLAEVGPDYIYVDDDHRYIFLDHKNTWGCACDLHVRRFSEITGRKWSRESLNAALAGDPAVRAQWIDFLGGRLVEIAGIIRRAVASVNPAIRVGEMVPTVHCLPMIGHTVRNNLDAFTAPGTRPLVRPCIGPYNDYNRRQIMAGLFYFEYTGALLGDDVDYTLEIETTPYTRLAKSLTTVGFHIVQGLLNRMNNHALSINGYVGDSPYLEPAYVDFLKDRRPYFEGVRRVAPRRGTRKGIQLIWDFDAPKMTPGKIGALSDLFWPSFACHDILGNLGLAVTYDESPVRFLVGDSVRALPKERIAEILTGGVLLDACAAQALNDLGFGPEVGSEVIAPLKGFGAEECVAPEFCGPYVNTYIRLLGSIANRVFALKPHADARVISRITDHDLKPVGPGVVLYQNSRGGRVAVFPYKLDPTEDTPRHFVCYHRLAMFKAILNWMRPGVLPVTVEQPSDFGVQAWEDEHRLTACLTNLSYDVADAVTIRIERPGMVPDRAYTISRTGRKAPLGKRLTAASSPQGALWKIKGPFSIFDPFILIVEQ